MTSENRHSVTLDQSMEIDTPSGAYDISNISTSTTDDYVHVVQVGGGCRAPSSHVVVTPTQTLRPRNKATPKDTGQVRDAPVRQRQLPIPAPPLGQMGLNDDPFLSEPVIQPSRGSQQPPTLLPPSGSTNQSDHDQGVSYFLCSIQIYSFPGYRWSI